MRSGETSSRRAGIGASGRDRFGGRPRPASRCRSPRGDHRLGQPGGSGVAVVEHQRCELGAAALEEAMLRFGKPRIFNTDQGSTFTAEAFAGKLAAAGVAISMDGRGRFMDNIFIERLWRSIKYEEVHLKAYADGREARGRHQFLDDLLQFSAPGPGDEQPDADDGVARRHGQNRGGGEGCGYAASLGQRKRVAHIPTAEAEAARSGLVLEGQGQARLHLKPNPSWSDECGPVHTEPHPSE
jgi:hypothetical protein